MINFEFENIVNDNFQLDQFDNNEYIGRMVFCIGFAFVNRGPARLFFLFMKWHFIGYYICKLITVH